MKAAAHVSWWICPAKLRSCGWGLMGAALLPVRVRWVSGPGELRAQTSASGIGPRAGRARGRAAAGISRIAHLYMCRYPRAKIAIPPAPARRNFPACFPGSGPGRPGGLRCNKTPGVVCRRPAVAGPTALCIPPIKRGKSCQNFITR